MRRYEGFLRRSEGKPLWPSRWWIVAVELGHRLTETRDRMRRSTLTRWSAAVLDCDGPRCISRNECTGTTAGEFWDVFLAQGEVQGSTYVCSPRALMAWQLLGLWERIETGNVRVQSSGSAAIITEAARQTCGNAGLLLTADPPTAARLVHHETGRQFSWVCAGNYGLQPLSAGIDAAGEARHLSNRILSCTRLLADHQLGGWGITAGAMALRGWLQSYAGNAIYCSSGRQGDEMEMAAVAGGVLIANPTGEEPVTAYSVDARSMYPYICAHLPQGTNLLRRSLRYDEATRSVRRAPLAHLARVEIETDRPVYPLRTADGVIYPVGQFVTVLCGPELEEALKANHVKSIICANEYELGMPTAAWQRRVWDARVASESGEARLAAPLIKRLGVAIVGKLFQRTEIWQECMPDITDPLWGSWEHFNWQGQRHRYQARAGITEVCTGIELTSHAIPSIPLWVWSWGRVRLWRWIAAAGLDALLYADTDGLLLRAEGYERLASSNILNGGAWGLLRHVAGPSPCVVRGPKDFTLGERMVRAGHPISQRQGVSQIGETAWYRLPWDQLHDPGCNGSWVEEMR